MQIFGKKKKERHHPKKTTNINEEKIFENDSPLHKKTVKKKTKIGFQPFKKAKQKKKRISENIQPKPVEKDDLEEDLEIDSEKNFTKKELVTSKTATNSFSTKKKKAIIKKDMKGKTVYLEDTGEKLGKVFDTINDDKNDITGYKIKDEKSEAVLSFPLDQFYEDKKGLVFVPGWYNNALKIIEKLEFKDKISPELTALLSDDAVSNQELYNIFVKHDDEMAKYIEDAISLREVLNSRLKVLEKERYSLKEKLMDLTEKRLIKDIDRRQFSEDVIDHRRKANILDVNIKKCKNLMKRLDETSFGILGLKQNNLDEDKNESEMTTPLVFHEKDIKQKDNLTMGKNVEMPYREKYYALKDQFQQLEEEYQELKSSVEKLITNE